MVETETQESKSMTITLKSKSYTYLDMLDSWIGGKNMGEKCEKNSVGDLPTNVLDFSSFMRKNYL